MVLQREGKKSELEFCVKCGSRTENGIWFSSLNTFYWFKYKKTYIFLECLYLQTNLLRLHWPEKEHHSLSVIYKNGECSLDLVFPTRPGILEFRISLLLVSPPFLTSIYNHVFQICKDKDQADCWHLGLTALVSALYSPLLLVDSTSSRRIYSCANSPPGYIQQRNRLFSVHDTRKFSQVRFGTYACHDFYVMWEHDYFVQVWVHHDLWPFLDYAK